MKIAIYGKSFNASFLPSIKAMINELRTHEVNILIYREFYEFIKQQHDYIPDVNSIFSNYNEITEDIDFMFSIGGDGTFLESISFVRNKNITLVGINSGRLGFLADIAQDEILSCLKTIFDNSFSYETRSLIEVQTSNNIFGDLNFALNEVTIQKQDTSSMITIHAYLNDKLINSYWADGLIIATPTGSTAYSLSVGGPIVAPNSKNFILTPLAPHNLTVRPIVVADSNVITLKVQSRSQNFLTALDHRSAVFDVGTEIKLQKANFTIKLLKLDNHNFYKTLRNKLMWGVDKRN